MTDQATPKKPRKRREKGPFSDELLDQLLSHLKGYDAESLLGQSGLVGQLKKQLMERMLAGELTQHLRSEAEAGASGNHRNGTTPKTVLAGEDSLELAVPRDRLSTFDPLLVAKHQRRLLKFRDGGTVKNKAVYLALGIDRHGSKDVLGMWIEESEGAKFWLRVFNELRNRGLQDILIAVVDGLRGFPDAIEAVFPHAQIQTCVVHLLRNSMDQVSWKDRKALAAALKPIYQAPDALAAEAALSAFEKGPWARWPGIAQAWRRQWPQVVPFFAYPEEVRVILYTTNAIESLHMQVRKVCKSRGHFPSDDASRKLLYLALRNITKKWTMPHRYWRTTASQLTIMFGDRFTRPDTQL